ncbi:MAG: RNA polymerase sigma factor [Thermaurantimonas sp.]
MSTLEFSNMISSHRAFLHQLAMKLTKDIDDAKDLIQETFFKAIKNKDKYEEGTNIKGWLYTIMKNTFINQYRKKKFQNTFIDETDNKFFISQSSRENVVSSDKNLDMEYLMKCIESVDRVYLETFMMYYNGYKYEEIAEIMNIPLGTVKSRIFLARKKMMERLKDYR